MLASKLPKFSSTSILTLALALILALALTWVLSLREVRLKIGDYYYNQGKFDHAVNWYEKVVRKEKLKIDQNRGDRLKHDEDLSKLKSALRNQGDIYFSQNKFDQAANWYERVLREHGFKGAENRIDRLKYEDDLSISALKSCFFLQAQHHLSKATNYSKPDNSDLHYLDEAVAEYDKLIILCENNKKHLKYPNYKSNNWCDETIKECNIRKKETVLVFGERCIKNKGLKEARYFFTKTILNYMNPVDALTELNKHYNLDKLSKIREKIWGGDIFVTLEDFEDTNKPILKDWARSTEPTVNIHTISSKCVRTGNYSEYFDLSYGKSGYDYWAKSVNIPLSNPDLILGVRLFIKSKEQFRCSLRINIVYPKQGINGVWQTDIHKNTMDGWEERRIDNLYDKARLIALQPSWDINGMTIDKIIIDTQGFSNKFYVDDIELYLIKIDKTLK